MTRLAKWSAIVDPRRLLARPAIYGVYQALITRRCEHAVFANEYVCARHGDRILDVGCGPANLLSELPAGVDYVGFDSSQPYIDAARRRFGSRGSFLCRHVDRAVIEELGAGTFDRVIAHGLIHHLDDAQAVEFFELAKLALAPQGKLVTLDGCFVPGQSPVSAFLLRRDRGRFVRDESGYRELCGRVFAEIATDIREDLCRVPYTLIVMQARPACSGGRERVEASSPAR